MDKTMSIIHLEVQFFSIYEPVKLKNKLPAYKIPCWDRHRIVVIDIPIQKGRKWKA